MQRTRWVLGAVLLVAGCEQHPGFLEIEHPDYQVREDLSWPGAKTRFEFRAGGAACIVSLSSVEDTAPTAVCVRSGWVGQAVKVDDRTTYVRFPDGTKLVARHAPGPWL